MQGIDLTIAAELDELTKQETPIIEQVPIPSTQTQQLNDAGLNNDVCIKNYSDFIDKINNSTHLSSLSTKELYNDLEEANKMISNITKDINLLIDKIKSIYNYKYPQLPSIVPNPYNYIRTVQSIEENYSNQHNNIITSLSQEHFSFLPSNILMALTFTLTTTTGNKTLPLDKSIQISNQIRNIYPLVLELYSHREKILDFVNKHMKLIAPNLTALLGADIAGKIITAVGGLEELVKIPSGSILNIGSNYITSGGLATKHKVFNGYISEVESCKKANEDMKIKVLRRYANKASLAAKKDLFRIKRNIKVTNDIDIDEDNEYGKQIKKEITDVIEKIENNKQPVLKKPLPKPDEKPRRKRAGKRTRSIAQRYEATNVRIMKNRMAFGVQSEEEYRDTGKGFGMLKVGGVGSMMRLVPQNDGKIVTKKQKEYDLKYNKGNKGGNKDLYNGIHSTLIMNAHSGIRLVNPDLLKEQLENEKEKYFSNSCGFATVVKNRMNKDG
jgi:U4/U6 small nuclear ribonucleoprotein PRP31